MVEKDVPLRQSALIIDRSTESELPNDVCACAESRTVLHSIECDLEKEVSDVLRDDFVHDNNFEHIPLSFLFWILSINGIDIFSCWAGDLRSVEIKASLNSASSESGGK